MLIAKCLVIKRKAMKMKRSVRRRLGLVLGVLMLTVSVLSLSTASSAQIGIGISVRIGPPALPVYAQPICPGPGYLWTPGYWAWNDDGGYYWVPGTWVVAPVGMLWTPGYWGFAGGFYGWHAGYWGPHVGFYGGINYGFGYGGVGFAGGEWRGGAFFYNRAVMNVNVVNVRNVYSRTVVVNNVHTSGLQRPRRNRSAADGARRSYAHEPHTAALAAQPNTNMPPARTGRCSHPRITGVRPLRPRAGRASSRDATSTRARRLGAWLSTSRRCRPRKRAARKAIAGSMTGQNDGANDRAPARSENQRRFEAAKREITEAGSRGRHPGRMSQTPSQAAGEAGSEESAETGESRTEAQRARSSAKRRSQPDGQTRGQIAKPCKKGSHSRPDRERNVGAFVFTPPALFQRNLES
jgi:hypothetical protein